MTKLYVRRDTTSPLRTQFPRVSLTVRVHCLTCAKRTNADCHIALRARVAGYCMLPCMCGSQLRLIEEVRLSRDEALTFPTPLTPRQFVLFVTREYASAIGQITNRHDA
jgi:hypothetical protein